MSILISLLITILVIFLVLYLINMLPLDGKVKQIAQIIVIIIGIISLLKYRQSSNRPRYQDFKAEGRPKGVLQLFYVVDLQHCKLVTC